MEALNFYYPGRLHLGQGLQEWTRVYTVPLHEKCQSKWFCIINMSGDNKSPEQMTNFSETLENEHFFLPLFNLIFQLTTLKRHGCC